MKKTNTKQELIEKYIESLDEKEKKTLEIAKSHLESSFDIEKSIGFITFKEKNNIEKGT
tara:strand:+ start:4813 stop:4989 length:177 start_codon:yes stop_codon:yes gene_type:complete